MVSKRVVLADVPRHQIPRYQKPERGYIPMFRHNLEPRSEVWWWNLRWSFGGKCFWRFFPAKEARENLLPNFPGSSPPISPKTSPTSLCASLVLIHSPKPPFYETALLSPFKVQGESNVHHNVVAVLCRPSPPFPQGKFFGATGSSARKEGGIKRDKLNGTNRFLRFSAVFLRFSAKIYASKML